MAISGLDIMPPLEKKYTRLLFYSRFLILHTLYYFDQDGISYDDLKDTRKIGIPEGSLSPNLLWLKLYGYIREDTVEDERKTAYYITQQGKNAFLELHKWLSIMIDLVDRNGNKKG